MKFDEFMELYDNFKETDKRILFVKEHITKSYIPLEEKDVRAQIIINNSYYDEDGNFKVNSVAKHMFTFLSIVDMYTDIDIDFKDCVNVYNQLDETEILNDILDSIDKKDLSEFKIILDLKCDDVMVNEYNSHSYISKQVERFGELVGNVLKPVIENLDVEKIIEVLNDNS